MKPRTLFVAGVLLAGIGFAGAGMTLIVDSSVPHVRVEAEAASLTPPER